MAKIDLKFLDADESNRSIKVDVYKHTKKINEIIIEIRSGSRFESIYLDKSTAIKFAKTLRAKINEITKAENK